VLVTEDGCEVLTRREDATAGASTRAT
jgi:hypothetical protein